MGRKRRSDLPDGWFHVMNRGVARREIFDTTSDGEHFVHLLGECVEQTELEVHAYCLMSNHFHLLVRGSVGELSTMMHRLGTQYVPYYNRARGRDGPLFRSRFHCKSVATDSYVVAVSRYIHRNPLERMGIGRLADYRWSSLGCYAGRRRAPTWLSMQPTLDEIGGIDAYERFVHRDLHPTEIDLDWAIATAIEVADLPVRLNSKGLARCVAVTLLETADADLAEHLRTWAGCARPDEPLLLAKAAARVERNPELQVAIQQARAMLGQAA